VEKAAHRLFPLIVFVLSYPTSAHQIQPGSPSALKALMHADTP